jgi:hypothetical protein
VPNILYFWLVSLADLLESALRVVSFTFINPSFGMNTRVFLSKYRLYKKLDK